MTNRRRFGGPKRHIYRRAHDQGRAAGEGEGTRRLLENSPEYSRDGMGAYFLTLCRNKESVAIDLKSPEGLELFYSLVKQADIVYSNFGAGVTKRQICRLVLRVAFYKFRSVDVICLVV